MAPHSSTLAWKIPWTEEPGRAAVRGVAKSRTWLSDFIFTFHFHALEKEMATRSSVLAWRIPGTVEPGGLPSMGSHRVGHEWSDLAAAAAAAALSHGSHELHDAFLYSWLIPTSVPYYDNERCLKTLMNVSEETKLLSMEVHWLKGIIVINLGWRWKSDHRL